jgi:hypothetical protein
VKRRKIILWKVQSAAKYLVEDYNDGSRDYWKDLPGVTVILNPKGEVTRIITSPSD